LKVDNTKESHYKKKILQFVIAFSELKPLGSNSTHTSPNKQVLEWQMNILFHKLHSSNPTHQSTVGSFVYAKQYIRIKSVPAR